MDASAAPEVSAAVLLNALGTQTTTLTSAGDALDVVGPLLLAALGTHRLRTCGERVSVNQSRQRRLRRHPRAGLVRVTGPGHG